MQSEGARGSHTRAGGGWPLQERCGGSVRVREQNWALRLRLPRPAECRASSTNVIRIRGPIKASNRTLAELWLTLFENSFRGGRVCERNTRFARLRCAILINW